MKAGEKEKGLHESCFHETPRVLRNMTVFCWPSGPNAISVSLSPMGRYVMVGLASRRILLHPSTEHMVAQVFRLQQAHGGETSMRVSVIAYISPGLGRVMRDCDVILLSGQYPSPDDLWPVYFSFRRSELLKIKNFQLCLLALFHNLNYLSDWGKKILALKYKYIQWEVVYWWHTCLMCEWGS